MGSVTGMMLPMLNAKSLYKYSEFSLRLLATAINGRLLAGMKCWSFNFSRKKENHPKNETFANVVCIREHVMKECGSKDNFLFTRHKQNTVTTQF